MKIEEFKELIAIISSNYPSDFNLNEYQLNYWFDELKKYHIDDVLKRLDAHLKGEYSYMPPKLTFLLKNLLTDEEKQEKIYVICPLCKSKFEYPLQKEAFENCLNRCNSIDYISRKSKELAIDPRKFFKSNAKVMDNNEFGNSYNMFLKEVFLNHIDKLDPIEKKVITNIFVDEKDQISISEITTFSNKR